MLKLKVAALAAAALALTACGTTSPAASLAAAQLTTTSSDTATSEPTTEPTTSEPTTDSTTPEPTTSTKTPPMEPKAGVDHQRIALDRVGGGQVTKVERELEHGRTEWKYRILHNGQTYEIRVDAASGRITRFESKK